MNTNARQMQLRAKANTWVDLYNAGQKSGTGGQSALIKAAKLTCKSPTMSRFLAGQTDLQDRNAEPLAMFLGVDLDGPRNPAHDIAAQLRILADYITNNAWSPDKRGAEFSRVITAFYDGMDGIIQAFEEFENHSS